MDCCKPDKDINMKSKIRIVVFFLLMFLMVQSLVHAAQRMKKSEATTSAFGIENQATVGKIQKGMEIVQTFTAEKNFSGISMRMATYNKTIYNRICIQLLDGKTDEVICKKSYCTGAIEDNAYHHFLFGQEIQVKDSRMYKVVITSDSGKFRRNVTIWNSQDDQYKDGSLYINGEKQTGDLVFNIVYDGENVWQWGMFLHRASLLILLFSFLGVHCFVDIRKMYQWIFEKRVWIALAVFAFLVLNKYNFSSIEQFDLYIQPKEGSEYVSPVAGKSRAIRSDEWMYAVPRFLSAAYSDYGKYNELVRAEKTTNLSASGLYRNYSALAQPADWGFYLFGSEYGLAFRWCFKMVFGFFFAYELCLILSERKKLLSLLGASLIWFSGCNMWWSTMNWVLAGTAALVFVYYFLEEENRKKRIFWGIGIAVFGSCFAVVDLYPAWQVPAGYLYLLILIWMFADHWQKIRSYQWKDWMLALGSIAFLASIAAVYLINDMEYLTDIMNTQYPGKRVSYGGRTIQHLLGYIPTFLMPLQDYVNPSEAGRFVNFFPIPFVLALVLFVYSKKKDLLTGLLLGGTAFLSLYCMVELPAGIAKIFLLTFSTPDRTALVLGFAQILLLIVALARYEEGNGVKLPLGIVMSVLTAGVTLWYTMVHYADYIRGIYVVLLVIFVFGILTLIISNVRVCFRQYAMAGMSIFMIVTGLMVNPLMCGIDAITSKPAAKAVSEIIQKDSKGKWIALDNIAAGNFLIACGAPTINSVNYIPNMEMWKKLDTKGNQEEIYNRYAHILMSLTEEETKMELKQADMIDLKLSYTDLDKLDVSYIFTGKPLENQENVKFEELYQESGVYIYKIKY